MKKLLLLLFLPVVLHAQELPDTALAKQLNVTKLLLLRYENGALIDTEAVYLFDGAWKTPDGFRAEQEAPLSDSVSAYSHRGRTVFHATPFSPYCNNDTVGRLYRYNERGQLVYEKIFSCEKGDAAWFFEYDTAGRWTTKYNDPPLPYVQETRIERHYDTSGRPIGEIRWWTKNPRSDVRESADALICKTEYQYDHNGLISEAIIQDPLRACYGQGKMPDGEDIGDGLLTFRYVYVFR